MFTGLTFGVLNVDWKPHTRLESVLSCARDVVVVGAVSALEPLLLFTVLVGATVSLSVVVAVTGNDDSEDDDDNLVSADRFLRSFSSVAVLSVVLLDLSPSSLSSSLLGGKVGSEMLTLLPLLLELESVFLVASSSSSSPKSSSKSTSEFPRVPAPLPAPPPPKPLRRIIGPSVRNK